MKYLITSDPLVASNQMLRRYQCAIVSDEMTLVDDSDRDDLLATTCMDSCDVFAYVKDLSVLLKDVWSMYHPHGVQLREEEVLEVMDHFDEWSKHMRLRENTGIIEVKAVMLRSFHLWFQLMSEIISPFLKQYTMERHKLDIAYLYDYYPEDIVTSKKMNISTVGELPIDNSLVSNDMQIEDHHSLVMKSYMASTDSVNNESLKSMPDDDDNFTADNSDDVVQGVQDLNLTFDSIYESHASNQIEEVYVHGIGSNTPHDHEDVLFDQIYTTPVFRYKQGSEDEDSPDVLNAASDMNQTSNSTVENTSTSQKDDDIDMNAQSLIPTLDLSFDMIYASPASPTSREELDTGESIQHVIEQSPIIANPTTVLDTLNPTNDVDSNVVTSKPMVDDRIYKKLIQKTIAVAKPNVIMSRKKSKYNLILPDEYISDIRSAVSVNDRKQGISASKSSGGNRKKSIPMIKPPIVQWKASLSPLRRTSQPSRFSISDIAPIITTVQLSSGESELQKMFKKKAKKRISLSHTHLKEVDHVQIQSSKNDTFDSDAVATESSFASAITTTQSSDISLTQYIESLTQYVSPSSTLDDAESISLSRDDKVTKVKDIIKLFEPKKKSTNQMNKAEWLRKTSGIDSKEVSDIPK